MSSSAESPPDRIDPLAPVFEPAPLAGERSRIASLDVFRGLTIAGMILVNNPGDWQAVYPPLVHAEWNGWTLADLVFPFFLFIVGVAIPLSLNGSSSPAGVRRRALGRIVRRTSILVALGLVLNALGGFESLATLRLPGVLQRIALCYLACSLLFLYGGSRVETIALVALLLGYWMLLELARVPGGQPGVLDPEHNLAAYLDRQLLGRRHLYHESWDPEGLLSTLPAVATTIAGVLTGRWLRSERSPSRMSAGLVCAGFGVTAAGVALSSWIPINKGLWTSSYVVFTAGLALILFGACHWLVDARGVRRPFAPLIVFGVNPIVVYVLSTAVAGLGDHALVGDENVREWICGVVFAPWLSPPAASLVYAGSYVFVWLAVMTLLYRRKIFIKI